jgi:hypothetical protein
VFKEIASGIIEYSRHLKYRQELENGIYPLLDFKALRKFKASDTIFILGSSPSILSIQPAEWNEIKSHDSMGVNMFGFHDHVPTFYSLEMASTHVVMFHYLFSEIEDKYRSKNVQFIFNYYSYLKSHLNFHKFPPVIKDNCSFALHRFSFVKNIDSVKLICRKLIDERMKENLDYRSLLMLRGSVVTCVQFAWALGYKNICLPGVDLKNQNYFYEKLNTFNAKEYTKLEQLYWFYGNHRLDRNSSHATQDSKLSKPNYPSMTEILSILQKELLEPSNAQIFAYSEESLLSQYFPVWNRSSVSP